MIMIIYSFVYIDTYCGEDICKKNKDMDEAVQSTSNIDIHCTIFYMYSFKSHPEVSIFLKLALENIFLEVDVILVMR